jgi:MFS-type transporter involved in bile tolerance (Atg22 family)
MKQIICFALFLIPSFIYAKAGPELLEKFIPRFLLFLLIISALGSITGGCLFDKYRKKIHLYLIPAYILIYAFLGYLLFAIYYMIAPYIR